MTKAQENTKISKEENISLLLLQTTELWRCKMHILLEEYQLNLTQFILLKSLDDLEDQERHILQKDLVSKCCIDKMTVSKSLRNIEKRGFIKREASKRDRRAMQVQLTDLGKRMLYLALIDVEALGEVFYKKLSLKKEKSLKKIMSKLIEHNSSNF